MGRGIDPPRGINDKKWLMLLFMNILILAVPICVDV